MDINIIAMGQRIRSSRREKNISSEVLAEKIGIAVESLWHIENGARNTSLQTLCNIAEALDVSVDYLLGRSDSPTPARDNLLKMAAETDDPEELLALLDIVNKKLQERK